jgi:quercetin dioxygenase-like cupin family protein
MRCREKLRDALSVRNKVKKTADWGSQVWLANKSLSGASLAVTRLTIHPGKLGERHRHPNADEVLILFRGKVCVHTPTEKFMLQQGDGLSILGGLTHQIENIGDEDADMVPVYSSGDRKYVAE